MQAVSTLAEAYRLFQDGSAALSVVEQRGIRIDVEYVREKIAWLDGKIEQNRRRLERSRLGVAWAKRFPKVNYGSGPQLRAVLYADMRVEPFKKTQSGEEGIDEESLRQVDVEGVGNLLQMRRYKKMRDVLVGFDKYQVDGVLRPSFALHTVSTFRSSSLDPNMQNVPSRDPDGMEICRRAVVPSPGYIILEVDFKGIEVSIACTYHRDPRMREYLNDPKSNMHGDMARQIFWLPDDYRPQKGDNFNEVLRQSAKNGFVFPQFYGDWYESCAFNIAFTWCKLPRSGRWRETDGVQFRGVPLGRLMLDNGVKSLEEFAAHMKGIEDDFWNNRFRVYNRWRKKWYEAYQRTGRFEMKTGFVCAGHMARNQVINYPVQGAAFHCLLKVLIELVRRLRGWRSAVIGEIHDSMLIDCHPDEFREVVSLCHYLCSEWLLQQWTWIDVPMSVEVKASEVDGSWARMAEVVL